MVPIQSIQIIQEEYCKDVDEGGQEVSSVEAGESVCQRLENDEGPGQAEPVRFSPSHFFNQFVHILIYDLIDDFFLEIVDLWVVFLKLSTSISFYFDEIKCHANCALSLLFEIEEAIWSL